MGRKKLFRNKSTSARFDLQENSDGIVESDDLYEVYNVDLNSSEEEKIYEKSTKTQRIDTAKLKATSSIFKSIPVSPPKHTIQDALNSIENLLSDYLQNKCTITLLISALKLKEFDYLAKTPEEEMIAKVQRFIGDADQHVARNSALTLEYENLLRALKEDNLSITVRNIAFRAFYQKWVDDVTHRHVNTP